MTAVACRYCLARHAHMLQAPCGHHTCPLSSQSTRLCLPVRTDISSLGSVQLPQLFQEDLCQHCVGMSKSWRTANNTKREAHHSTPTHNSATTDTRIISILQICSPFYLFFSPSHLLSSPFDSLSLLVATQIRGHIAGSSPPVPTTVRALHFYREKISVLSSLVDSRRKLAHVI